MGIAFDIIFIFIIIACLVTGYKKGLIGSALNLIGFICASFFGYKFSGPLGELYYNRIFYKSISEKVSDHVDRFSAQNDGIGGLVSNIPDAFRQFLNNIGITGSQVMEKYAESVKQNDEQIRKSIADFIAQPAAEIISDILAFLTIFIAVIVFFALIRIVLELIFKLPLLKTVNKMLGLLLGVCVGVLYIQIFAFLLRAVFPTLTSIEPSIFPPDMIENSLILKPMTQTNIFDMIFS